MIHCNPFLPTSGRAERVFRKSRQIDGNTGHVDLMGHFDILNYFLVLLYVHIYISPTCVGLQEIYIRLMTRCPTNEEIDEREKKENTCCTTQNNQSSHRPFRSKQKQLTKESNQPTNHNHGRQEETKATSSQASQG